MVRYTLIPFQLLAAARPSSATRLDPRAVNALMERDPKINDG